MQDKNNHDTAGDSHELATDGGMSDVKREQQIDYMDVEINLLKPATPFMRDHLRVIWLGFAVWVLTTFAPITLTRLAPDVMTTQMPVIGFPLHYFLIAIVGPSAALILSVWYAKKRDQIDEKYGIEQPTAATETTETVPDDAAATDGGTDE
ncbi:DUF4212 domain-containing protein [Natronobacterium texcoconense]|uniref:Putative solute:sodium symporter small subunit n=1 Tax=Natronobacterium texcoconense TaxID=1095778 RepID=A0A1H1B3T1_NATTX|nr:DUF4212 domain-containing protein [Natronobacterium texcoconense]SDQ46599.1 putative solute:sodium symporter small subunit [Natronobacterium texcoconense]